MIVCMCNALCFSNDIHVHIQCMYMYICTCIIHNIIITECMERSAKSPSYFYTVHNYKEQRNVT